MPAYIRKYRVYPTADPKKAQAVRTMSTDAEHFTAGHSVQFYLQYLLSDGEQYTGCPFQRPALRVLSLQGICALGRSCRHACSPALARSLACTLLLLYQQSESPSTGVSFRGKRGSRWAMPAAWKTTSPISRRRL